ncbi:TPA: phosphocarrier protein HPr [bacterium]|nr:phosphocarrier protein HPr [bacterium]
MVKNKAGIHARPASMIAQIASKFISEIYIRKDEGFPGWMNGKSLLGILSLEIFYGDKATVRCDGPDEKEAMRSIAKLFLEKFKEE